VSILLSPEVKAGNTKLLENERIVSVILLSTADAMDRM